MKIFITRLAVIVTLFSALVVTGSVHAEKSYAKFDKKGQLIRPQNYREWIYIGAPLTPNDMNNGKAAFPEFHNVYIDPASWAHWKKTGEFRDGTVIMKELVSVATKTSSSGNGYFMGDFQGLEAAVKDTKRFPASDKHWGFFRFTTADHKVLLDRSQVNKSESCAACHGANAKQEMIFLQHYPVLRAEKEAIK